MTECEFWTSTLAKVTELYRLQILVWAKTRDYFTAQIAAISINKVRSDQSHKVWTAEDFLNHRYPATQPDTVMITADPDKGAVCGWQDLRQSLKDRQEARKQRRVN